MRREALAIVLIAATATLGVAVPVLRLIGADELIAPTLMLIGFIAATVGGRIAFRRWSGAFVSSVVVTPMAGLLTDHLLLTLETVT